MNHGDPVEGRKIVQKIWDAMTPKIYTEKQVQEFVNRVVEEIKHNGLIFYSDDPLIK